MRKISAEIFSGVAIFLAFVIFIFGFLFLKNTAFKGNRNSLFVTFKDVTGLEPNDVVNVAGLKVGQVEDFQLKDLTVTVEIRVDEDIALPKDSRVQIKSLGMVGEKFIEIIPGESTEILQDGAFLEGSNSGDFSDLTGSVDGLIEQTEQLFDQLRNIITTVFDQTTQKDLKESLSNLNKISTTLAKNSDRMEQALANIENLSSNLNEIIIERRNKVETSIDNVYNASNRFDTLATKMENSLTSMETLLSKIENQEGAVGKVILNNELYDDLRGLTGELQGLVQDLKKRPQKYLNLGFIKIF